MHLHGPAGNHAVRPCGLLILTAQSVEPQTLLSVSMAEVRSQTALVLKRMEALLMEAGTTLAAKV